MCSGSLCRRLGKDIKIPLGSNSFDRAVLRDGPAGRAERSRWDCCGSAGYTGVFSAEEGGVVIYDDAVARANALCGWIQSGCTYSNGTGIGLYDSIQWNSTGTEMFAANNEDTGFDFYTVPVSSSGFGKVTDYGGLAGGFGQNIHYDAKTGYVYDDNGSIIDPASGSKVGTFAASGLMVPDGANGKAYFIGQSNSSYGSGTYTIESFDINKFVPISTLTVKNVVGTPTHFIRWGTNGLAFTTENSTYGSTATGAVYLVSGPIVSQSVRDPSIDPAKDNVQRTWAFHAPVVRQANPQDEVKTGSR